MATICSTNNTCTYPMYMYIPYVHTLCICTYPKGRSSVVDKLIFPREYKGNVPKTDNGIATRIMNEHAVWRTIPTHIKAKNVSNQNTIVHVNWLPWQLYALTSWIYYVAFQRTPFLENFHRSKRLWQHQIHRWTKSRHCP